jgi:hypothetical protein
VQSDSELFGGPEIPDELVSGAQAGPGSQCQEQEEKKPGRSHANHAVARLSQTLRSRQARLLPMGPRIRNPPS